MRICVVLHYCGVPSLVLLGRAVTCFVFTSFMSPNSIIMGALIAFVVTLYACTHTNTATQLSSKNHAAIPKKYSALNIALVVDLCLNNRSVSQSRFTRIVPSVYKSSAEYLLLKAYSVEYQH